MVIVLRAHLADGVMISVAADGNEGILTNSTEFSIAKVSDSYKQMEPKFDQFKLVIISLVMMSSNIRGITIQESQLNP